MGHYVINFALIFELFCAAIALALGVAACLGVHVINKRKQWAPHTLPYGLIAEIADGPLADA
jgi:hypothetical protein